MTSRALYFKTVCGVLAVGFVLSLSACQTGGTLSTAEALQITGSFKESGLKAPPKSVDDILQQLDASKGQSDERLKQARAVLAEPEPAGLEGMDRVRWLFDRGRAAHLTGDMSRELAYYREAREVFIDAGIRFGTLPFLVQFELARTELLGGDYSAALENMREAPSYISTNTDSENSQSFAPIPLVSYAALAYADAGTCRLPPRHKPTCPFAIIGNRFGSGNGRARA